ncbi:hypothetical protein BHM03_00000807 [Ensete ventricosum]|nr:hypothetical protein BHM03_00000807 [Ensete ventricosum]
MTDPTKHQHYSHASSFLSLSPSPCPQLPPTQIQLINPPSSAASSPRKSIFLPLPTPNSNKRQDSARDERNRRENGERLPHRSSDNRSTVIAVFVGSSLDLDSWDHRSIYDVRILRNEPTRRQYYPYWIVYSSKNSHPVEGYFGHRSYGCARVCQVGLYQSVAGIGGIGVRRRVGVDDQKAPSGGPAETFSLWVIWSRDVQIDFDGQDPRLRSDQVARHENSTVVMDREA